MKYKNCTYIIHENDCNGEALEFEKFLKREYPEIEIEFKHITSGVGGGLFTEDGKEHIDRNYLWDEYCKSEA